MIIALTVYLNVYLMRIGVLMFEIKKTQSCLGAYVEGLDLSKSFSEKTIGELKNALSDNEVLFFRNQNITHDDHKRLASSFGLMQTHPAYPTIDDFPEITILENDEKNPLQWDQIGSANYKKWDGYFNLDDVIKSGNENIEKSK